MPITTFPAIPVHIDAHREVRQPLRYQAGVAREYRCPVCGELHPLDRRDYDAVRAQYVGRFCDPARPVRANSPAERTRYQRERREARRAASLVA